jgi:ribosomal protein L11 methyltransferase
MACKPVWIEIKVAVQPPEADAVANFLIEIGSNGIVEESPAPGPSGVQTGYSILKAYILKDARTAHCIDSLKNYLRSLRKTDPRQAHQEPAVIASEIEDKDWNEQWKSFFQPIKVTDTIVIKPSWRNYWKKENEIVLELDPGMAFGTGTHSSTRLCLRAVEERAVEGAGTTQSSLLDVGTGSGILAIAAALLGIKQVVGIDIDVQAVECAKKNAAVNTVAEQVLFESTPLYKIPGSFSIVVANILPQTLIDMKDELIHHLDPSGYLILSGILHERAREIIAAFGRELSFKEETREEEWSCFIFQREPVSIQS